MVVCQKSKIDDWYEHFKTNYGTKFLVFDLTVKGMLKGFLHDVFEDPWTEIVGIINYELAWRRKDLLKLQDFTLLLDESSLIQNPTAKRTKFILKMRPVHVILLSGSPVGGKYENLWSQLHLLGWGISQELYQTQYVNWTLTDPDPYGMRHKIVDKEEPYINVERLKTKMRSHGADFLKTDEVLTLPDQVFQIIRVPMSKEYRVFKRDKIVEVHTGVFDQMINGEWDGKTYSDLHELVGDTTLTKLLYLRQLCGPYNQDKKEAFRDLLQSTGERLIVFYNWNLELDRLRNVCNEEKRPVSIVNGMTKDLTAYEECEDSVTLIQYQAGAYGLNLQKSQRIVYYSLPLSSELFEQSKKRIHRIGQDKTCFYYLLICSGSIEEQILQTLNERKDYTDELFRKENIN